MYIQYRPHVSRETFVGDPQVWACMYVYNVYIYIYVSFQRQCYWCNCILGKYDVHVKWNGRHIPKSPYRVDVSPDLDASKAYAKGPGLEPRGIVAGKYTDFTVYTRDAGEGQVTVKVIDPRGGEDVDVIIESQEDGEYFVEYQPVNTGKHTIKVMFGGQHISGSPFHVFVGPPKIDPIPSKVKVFGAGKFKFAVWFVKCRLITFIWVLESPHLSHGNLP